ncbi:GDP-mannose mannosyl hydrolase [Serratia fonticola]|uniref:GDP-mannose mannosyl hydrolase n=1 Tax=Serratia fonticola TaxID=47917 RepID=UPI0021AD543E|nr:GDP-mannose mannosyl hydrolase [Serratia fonticola]
MLLNSEDFKFIIKNTPLVSIDFIVKNNNKILVGKRTNSPARGFWFVPGGRILKDETIDNAFNRLSLKEIGLEIDFSSAKFIGVYEHHYNDNFFSDEFSTHYVVLCYEIVLNNLPTLPAEQHDSYLWLSAEEILLSQAVHDNTKLYFS